ncbi:hypothetical protein J5N97_004664 [Dioscorea zingiberensis]|uniref:NADPH-dependent diflavin oxidoreductase 1 n=1 Tax=Dioscorea zingiberensis TaxID=325984 RepID=A0A9D5D736_9LILI|nr:hypothetical protein J5N97_004664 [Dioscorea zingiberensis]
MDAAERVGREAERHGCPSVEVLSMDAFDADCLPLELIVIFVVSTTGQGDVPDSMKEFWKFLLRRNLSHQWLHELHYAVFGLGDSGYQKYNFTAKKLDKRLLDLGATPIIEKGLGDDQHRSGYEGALDPWLSSLWSALSRTFPTIISSNSDSYDSQGGILDQPKFEVTFHGMDNMQSSVSFMKDYETNEKVVEKARLMSSARYSHEDSRPHHFLKMIANQRLTQVDYTERDVQPKSVDKRLNDMVVPVKLRTFVALTMDIASASPRRYFFEVMSFFATAEHEKERLQYFASAEGRDDLYQYNQKERRSVLEVLKDFPSVQLPFEWLVQLVPPLKMRAFSISSSPLAHPNQVHITVSIVSWMTPYKRKRSGLCSTWLAGLDPHSSAAVNIPAWVRQGLLPPPPPSLPLILVGPGTGCAPFHAFVEERAVQSLKRPKAQVLFFFGCRNEDKDFQYKDFWFSHAQNQGVLSTDHGGGFFVAFSRDQPHKIYVQHKIKEESARIWRLLNQGAAIYIAGSSTKMPADVTSAIEEIISEEAGISKESAVMWLRRLEKAGRFYIEAWS